MNKTYLVTVADDRQGRKGGKYGATQHTIRAVVDKFIDVKQFHYSLGGVIDVVGGWSPCEMRDRILHLLENPDPGENGRVYKPAVIKEVLHRMDEGDYLIYSDCSPEMWHFDFDLLQNVSLGSLQMLCDVSQGNLSCFVPWDVKPITFLGGGIHTHYNFTSTKCLRTIPKAWEYRHYYQHAGGMLVLRKDFQSEQFVSDWLYWNSIADCCAVGDGKTIRWGHRCDQSISGILKSMLGFPLLQPSSYLGGLHPCNFLNYCVGGHKLIPAEANALEGRICVGDWVSNGRVDLKVFDVVHSPEGFSYKIGRNQHSLFAAKESDIYKIIQP